MNNILAFEDYKKINIRQVESVIYQQFIQDNNENEISEGFIRRHINKTSSNFIKTALSEEIEKGKELEKNIKYALDGLNKGFEELEKTTNSNNSNSNLKTIEKVKEAIKSVQSQTFDTLTMLGSNGEIDFAGFVGSATIAAAANFGILLSPIRSVFMTRKAYKYFIEIIKQTIRRNLLVIQLNFDQFENLILQKSFESEDDSEMITKSATLNSIISTMSEQLCGKDSKIKILPSKKVKAMKDYLDIFSKEQNALIKANKENSRNNPLRSLWEDQHNNTYTRTLEQIKQYINDDTQKVLESLKSSITKISGKNEDLVQYGELLISAAEEYAIKTTHGINNNFIKMSSVFNLDNQKKLIDLIMKAQEENKAEAEKKLNEKKLKDNEKILEKNKETGEKLYKDNIKDSTKKYTFDEFNDTFSENEQQCLKCFFQSDEGKDVYNELIEKNPLYKYLLIDDISLNNLLESINDLKIVKVSNIDDFYESIVKKDQTLYYKMAEVSIHDAIKSNKSEKYFGLIKNEKVINKSKHTIKNKIVANKKENHNELNDILNTAINVSKKGKTRYFLTFSGSGEDLFNILHKDFKSKIFKDNKEYENDISIEDKVSIMKIIHKNLKIGNSISTKFAEYLVRLEAHMLLTNQDPWFVAENNEELFKCFDINAEKIKNKNAFVEINGDDYHDIDKFLSKLHVLSDNDFIIESDKK
jgi:hypothetical protein